MNVKINFFFTITIGILLGLFLPLGIYSSLSHAFIRLSYLSLIPFLIFSIPLGIENIIENKTLKNSLAKQFIMEF